MSPRWRRYASVAMLATGLVALLGATLTLYVKDRVLDSDKFADSAVATLDDPDVDRGVSSAITDRVVDRIDPDLVTFKPLIESVVGSLLDTDALRSTLRKGARAAHAAVFDRNADGAALRLGDVGALVREGVGRIDPRLAKEIPRSLDASVLDFSNQPVFVDASQAADKVDRWAGILPGAAILLLGGSILVAPGRRRAAIRAGVAIAVLAAVLLVSMKVVRLAVLDRIDAGEQRDAAAAVWDEFMGDLSSWALILGAVGVVLATTAASLLRTFDLHEPLRAAWDRIVHEPERRSSRVWWAVGLLVVGLLMVFAAAELLRALIIALGVYLVARAVSALVAALAEWRGWSLERVEAAAQEARESDPISTRRVVAVTAGLVVVAAAAVAIGLSLVLRPGDESAKPAARTGECNGSREICERRLDEVAFLGTHNSYAGAGYPGFLFPEQEGTISSQLEAGVRGLWIDTYYGVPGGRVFTRTDKIDPALNAQLKATLGPKFEQAAERLRASIAKPPADAPTRIYLCHGFCELGAVDAEQAFEDIRAFLEQNPEEVLIIDLEDYTSPEDTVALLEKTGLAAFA